jgi:hypothetical protein
MSLAGKAQEAAARSGLAPTVLTIWLIAFASDAARFRILWWQQRARRRSDSDDQAASNCNVSDLAHQAAADLNAEPVTG